MGETPLFRVFPKLVFYIRKYRGDRRGMINFERKDIFEKGNTSNLDERTE